MNHLDWLEQYATTARVCVTMESLESGGWMVIIDTGERLTNASLANERTPAGWLSCSVTQGTFKGAGTHLYAILACFRSWLATQG